MRFLRMPQYEYTLKIVGLRRVRDPSVHSVARLEATRATQGVNEFVDILCVNVSWVRFASLPDPRVISQAITPSTMARNRLRQPAHKKPSGG